MKTDIKLTDREEAILAAVIDHHVQTAEPVGSRAIAQRYQLGLSPATIRNAMQDLEERGMLQQPHTSAGRVPTDLGYRYYVDRLLHPVPLTRSESKKIQQEVRHDPAALGEILAQTSKVLARVTNQLGVTVAPAFEKGVLTHIDIAQVASNRVLVIIAVKSGLARTLLLEVDSDLDPSLLDQTRAVLNERLSGLTLGEIRRTAAARLRDTKGEPRLIRMFVDSSDRLLTVAEGGDIHLGGASNIMAQPEFRDITSLTNLMHVIEDQKHLREWFAGTQSGEGIVITIGREFDATDLGQCSMVSSTYKVGHVEGTIGVLGPTRMPYSKLVSVVDYTARILTDLLSEE